MYLFVNTEVRTICQCKSLLMNIWISTLFTTSPLSTLRFAQYVNVYLFVDAEVRTICQCISFSVDPEVRTICPCISGFRHYSRHRLCRHWGSHNMSMCISLSTLRFAKYVNVYLSLSTLRYAPYVHVYLFWCTPGFRHYSWHRLCRQWGTMYISFDVYLFWCIFLLMFVSFDVVYLFWCLSLSM